mgnify:CR=1 FL=1
MESLDSYNLPLNRNVDIISYNNHGLISLNKKEGILSHPNNKIIEIDLGINSFFTDSDAAKRY